MTRIQPDQNHHKSMIPTRLFGRKTRCQRGKKPKNRTTPVPLKSTTGKKCVTLGRDYPLNTTKTARFRPDTAMVRYLDVIVWRFYGFRNSYPGICNRAQDEIKTIERAWKTMNEMKFDCNLVPILQASINLPPLTTATVKQWAEKAIVPYILQIDAKTPETCIEPALTKIWRQHRAGRSGAIKSISDFKSRLTPDVVKTLRSMAWPV